MPFNGKYSSKQFDMQPRLNRNTCVRNAAKTILADPSGRSGRQHKTQYSHNSSGYPQDPTVCSVDGNSTEAINSSQPTSCVSPEAFIQDSWIARPEDRSDRACDPSIAMDQTKTTNFSKKLPERHINRMDNSSSRLFCDKGRIVTARRASISVPQDPTSHNSGERTSSSYLSEYPFRRGSTCVVLTSQPSYTDPKLQTIVYSESMISQNKLKNHHRSVSTTSCGLDVQASSCMTDESCRPRSASSNGAMFYSCPEQGGVYINCGSKHAQMLSATSSESLTDERSDTSSQHISAYPPRHEHHRRSGSQSKTKIPVRFAKSITNITVDFRDADRHMLKYDLHSRFDGPNGHHVQRKCSSNKSAQNVTFSPTIWCSSDKKSGSMPKLGNEVSQKLLRQVGMLGRNAAKVHRNLEHYMSDTGVT